MILLDRNNQEVEVLSQYLLPNHTDTVYNIEVDNFHTYHVGKLGVWVHNADCCDLSITYNGKQANAIGIGGNKIVYDVGNGKVLAVLKEGKKASDLEKEVKMLKDLDNMGFPVVKVEMTKFEGKPALLMDKYAKGSKEIVRYDNSLGQVVVVKNADTSLLNANSVKDLQAIRAKMVKDKVKIDDLQFLIGNDGSVVISDPLKINTKTKPSKNNLDMIDLLIKEAKKKTQ